MEGGYVQALSDNLPLVDTFMINEFYTEHADFLKAEVRNVKMARAGRESYGDNAVGYVQLKRDSDICVVKGKITPEHRIRTSPYNVTVVIDEKEKKILSSQCNDCTASAGGCKHGVAFLLWLHRRSEEPSTTETTCYWKASSLSKIAKRAKNMTLADLVDKEIPPLEQKGTDFLNLIKNDVCGEGGIFDFHNEPKFQNTSLHQLSLSYIEQTQPDNRNAEKFIDFIKQYMNQSLCDAAEKQTRGQTKSPAWYELRYCRITASKIYEVSKCKTFESSLVETIFGAVPPLTTGPVSRGRRLEGEVLKEVEKMKKIKINSAGLFLSRDHPIFGASPDGISEDFVIEVKCPSKESTIKTYVENDQIQPKFLAQINMQMLFCRRQKGLFCVASPSFEITKEVSVYEASLDLRLCDHLIIKGQKFWQDAIYPLLVK